VARRLVRQGCEYVIETLIVAVMLCVAVDTASPRSLPDARASFDPRDIVSVVGTVVRVGLVPRAGGGGRDVTLVLRTDIGDEIAVAVASRTAVKRKGLRLRIGDEVRVAGWPIVRGKPALVAAEIGSEGRLFVFRDRHGHPL
jgi:hypothetical protein